jgi:hypothetical protein
MIADHEENNKLLYDKAPPKRRGMLITIFKRDAINALLKRLDKLAPEGVWGGAGLAKFGFWREKWL